jgi:hypothetical protein
MTFLEDITFPSVPAFLTASVVPTQISNEIRISPTAAALVGTATVVVHTAPRGRVGILPRTYAVTVTMLAPPPPDAGPPDAGSDAGPPDAGSDAGPPDAGTVVSVTSSADVVRQGTLVQLSCAVTGGVGPFAYLWHGYRDDGAPCSTGPCTLSDVASQFPSARLVFPTEDFYFFCVVTDSGVPASDPNSTATGYAKVSESDGPVGRFTVAPGPFQFGVDDVSFDASASTGTTVPVTWTIEQYVGTQTPAGGIEGFLLLNDATQVVWTEVYTTDTIPLTLTIPAVSPASPSPGSTGHVWMSSIPSSTPTPATSTSRYFLRRARTPRGERGRLTPPESIGRKVNFTGTDTLRVAGGKLGSAT